MLSAETTEQYEEFNTLLFTELFKQKEAFPGDLHSLHEAYGVLLEEVDELWDQVRLKDHKRDPANVVEELVQIAVMAARTAVELGYLEMATLQKNETQS